MTQTKEIVFPLMEYEKNNTSIHVFSSTNRIKGLWFESTQLMLDFEYDIDNHLFLHRKGVVGEIIESSVMPEEEKKQRVIEALTHAVWKSQL